MIATPATMSTNQRLMVHTREEPLEEVGVAQSAHSFFHISENASI